ncbi:hypothetical protein E1B28_002552 [Marasmius oreades]|uniref:Zn(2)-C6 fungal-type domain-containing protein n=1 Tax=Marasmius oreades TaxID=181124 RepID=A0A9P7RPB5_9AGAR|nr:uncharacterized protein E1B28_002552 [Marasmius oreades]KAG7086608.1 hypothetical protein E1B28_002552 [Marasmius oreades]
MSPTTSNHSSSSSSSRGAPYARRPSGQPKSSRQQFSACGACRMRRVRCDLKDLPIPLSGPNPACSNCRERGLKCVDEFADVKAVKLLRRGRRLQQVEAIYGKANSSSNGDSSGASTPRPSTIPNLHPDFFVSLFWSWFSIQRPVLDPVEFPARYIQAQSHGQPLSPHTTIISMLLVLWAFSYGLDERGIPFASSPGPMSSRKGRTQSMLGEILELLDIHAIMRSPTWDGLRILLLLQPLVDEDDSIHPLDRVALRDASLSQVVSLSSLSLSSAANPEDHAAVRTRLFWCAYIHESITAGLRGGRLFLTTDDLDLLAPVPSVPLTPSTLNFTNLHLFSPTSYGNGYSNHLPSPISPTFPPDITPPISSRNSPPLGGSSTPLSLPSPDSHLFATPLRLSTLIRKAHRIILSPRASKTIEANGGIVDAVAMRDLWKDLDSCWEELACIRKAGHGGEIEKWTSAWQLIIFECHNLIKESLKQLARIPSSPVSPTPNSPGSLYEVATRKCFRLLPSILGVVKYNLTYEATDLFRYDTGLVRDGLFYAAYLSATISSSDLVDYVTSVQLKSESVDDPSSSSYNVVGFRVEEVRPGLLPILDSDEGVNVCLAAMSEMGWTFSNGASGKGEREDLVGLVKSVWETRKGQGLGPNGFSPPYPFAQGATGTFYGMNPITDSLDGIPARYLSGHSSSPTSSGGSPHSDPGHPHLANSMSTRSLGELPYSSTITTTRPTTYIPPISHHSQSNHSSPSSSTSLQLGYSSHPSPHQLQSHSSPHLQNNHASQHPILPPLTLSALVRGGPNTAPELGNGNGATWVDYTPPGTAGSGAGSPGVAGFKSEIGDTDFYAQPTGYAMEYATS